MSASRGNSPSNLPPIRQRNMAAAGEDAQTLPKVLTWP
jgi:hypothetical protein